ncbi:MAG: hypothetical protein FJ244_02605 [Nitrospira sp.]|nr:hypothetical protein [Nitrospira sp.]
MTVPRTTSSPPAPRRYGWLPFLLIVTTVVVLGIGFFLFDLVGRSIASTLWLSLLILLVWSAIRLRVEYRQAL